MNNSDNQILEGNEIQELSKLAELFPSFADRCFTTRVKGNPIEIMTGYTYKNRLIDIFNAMSTEELVGYSNVTELLGGLSWNNSSSKYSEWVNSASSETNNQVDSTLEREPQDRNQYFAQLMQTKYHLAQRFFKTRKRGNKVEFVTEDPDTNMLIQLFNDTRIEVLRDYANIDLFIGALRLKDKANVDTKTSSSNDIFWSDGFSDFFESMFGRSDK